MNGRDQQMGKPPRVSFRDKVVGSDSSSALKNVENVDIDNLVKITNGSADSEVPSIEFSTDIKNIFSEPYKDVIIIKVLGRSFSYTAITHKLKGVWKTKGGYEVMDVGFGYFLIKFDLLEDKERVLLGGPWMIGGNYVAVKPWCSEFRPCENSFGSTLVWIKITGLNIWYYHEKLIMRIAALVGKPIRVDLATQSAERGKYARACIQIDLGKPVIQKIRVDGFNYEVEYENLHLLCNNCKCFGHVTRECINVDPWPVTADNGSKESAHHDSPPGQSSKSNLNHPIFTFGNNGENGNRGKIATGANGTEEKTVATLQADSTPSQPKKGEWTEVQRKGKNKLTLAKKKPTSVNSNPRSSKLVSKGRFDLASSTTSAGFSREKYKLGKASLAQPTTTPVTLHPHKRRRPPSLQNSPIEKDLAKGDGVHNVEVSAGLPHPATINTNNVSFQPAAGVCNLK